MGNAHIKEKVNCEITQKLNQVRELGVVITLSSKPKNGWYTVCKVGGLTTSNASKQELIDILTSVIEGDESVLSFAKAKGERAYRRGNKEKQVMTYAKDEVFNDVTDDEIKMDLLATNFNIKLILKNYLTVASFNVEDIENSPYNNIVGDDFKARLLDNSIKINNNGDYISTVQFEHFNQLKKRYVKIAKDLMGV